MNPRLFMQASNVGLDTLDRSSTVVDKGVTLQTHELLVKANSISRKEKRSCPSFYAKEENRSNYSNTNTKIVCNVFGFSKSTHTHKRRKRVSAFQLLYTSSIISTCVKQHHDKHYLNVFCHVKLFYRHSS